MGGGASWKLAKKIFTLQRCGGSLCLTQQQQQQQTPPVSLDSRNSSLENQKRSDNNTIISPEIAEPQPAISIPSSKKNLCAICLEPLKYKSGSKAIFTAQCSHAFHFACITSNVRHGSVTCPICRAHWTQLPRYPSCPLHNPARTSSFLRLRPPPQNHHPSLSFSLLTPNNHHYYYHLLRVKLSHPPPTDLVLVATPCCGSKSRLMKQAMALVVSSLRPVDRLSIVSCPEARRFRRMTPHGKAISLKFIDQMSLIRPQDSDDDLMMKGAEILGGRAHGNQSRSCILHLTTDNPSLTTSPCYYNNRLFDGLITIHRFDVGGGYEFEGFLARTLGGRAEDIQMRIGEGEGSMVVRIGEMRGGEERNIRLCGGDDDESGRVCVKYSYRDGECVRTGDVVVVVVEDKGDGVDGRSVCDGKNWDYQDSFMAARR